MVRILILSVFLTMFACKGVQEMQAKAELIENLKTEISDLKTEVDELKAQVDSLEVRYDTHLEEYHGKKVSKTQPTPKPRPKRMK